MKLDHQNIISYVDHYIDRSYIVLVTELYGKPWESSVQDSSTHAAAAKNNGDEGVRPTLVEEMPSQNDRALKIAKPRASCDLFECIDVRKSVALESSFYLKKYNSVIIRIHI